MVLAMAFSFDKPSGDHHYYLRDYPGFVVIIYDCGYEQLKFTGPNA
jgi:hypothetical protein